MDNSYLPKNGSIAFKNARAEERDKQIFLTSLKNNLRKNNTQQISNKEEDEEGEDLEDQLEKEQEDIESDPVRRQHFNYTENSIIVNGHPEIFLNDRSEICQYGLTRTKFPVFQTNRL